MKNIKENKRAIGEKVKWLTDDPDVLIETTTMARVINLKDLRERKERLESLIANQPSIEELVSSETERLLQDKAQFETELQSINNELNG